jgi:hypothetical protein
MLVLVGFLDLKGTGNNKKMCVSTIVACRSELCVNNTYRLTHPVIHATNGRVSLPIGLMHSRNKTFIQFIFWESSLRRRILRKIPVGHFWYTYSGDRLGKIVELLDGFLLLFEIALGLSIPIGLVGFGRSRCSCFFGHGEQVFVVVAVAAMVTLRPHKNKRRMIETTARALSFWKTIERRG